MNRAFADLVFLGRKSNWSDELAELVIYLKRLMGILIFFVTEQCRLLAGITGFEFLQSVLCLIYCFVLVFR